mgnify:CR=1 FL=1
MHARLFGTLEYTSTHSGAIKWRFLTLAFIPGLDSVVALTDTSCEEKPHGRRSLDPDTQAERANGVLGIQGSPEAHFKLV